MNHTRRDLLKFGAGAVALAAVGIRPASLFAEPAKKKIPIGLQLYSLRDVAGKDVPGTLDAVAKMGYAGVEFAGYYGRKAEDLRKLLDASGLKCCGTHTGLNTLMGDAMKGTIAFNKTLGNQSLIVPALPHDRVASVAALMDTAKLFTEIADKAKEQGMVVGYHAHAGDFKPVADRVPWDVIFGHAGANVTMQLDVGNCLQGKGDPIAVLKKYPGRSLTVHLKEFGKNGDVIGEGTVPWKEVFEICETTGGTQWYVVEQEGYRRSSMESAKLCLEALRKMGR